MTNTELIRQEIERRMLEDYNSGDTEIDEVAQGVCAALLYFIDSLQQEQPEAIGGVVHHALGVHWVVTNQEQLGARLKQFPEGAEVEILIVARNNLKKGE